LSGPVRAGVLERYREPLVLRDRASRHPEPGWVVVQVRAAGVCGSDLFLQNGGFASTMPIVPGHEASGVVTKLGAGERGIEPGTPVAVYYIDHCGHCDMCAVGRVNMCRRVRRMGVDYDGAFAEQVLVPEKCLIPVPPGSDPADIAVLTDAVATPYHALTTIGRVEPGETVLVLGVGGIGSNAVQLAKHLGCRVIALTRSKEKLLLAARLGAAETVPADERAPEAVADLTGGRGPDVVIQTVGSAAGDRQAFAVAGVGTRIVLIGTSTESFEMRSTEFIWRELTVLGSRGFTPREITEVIELHQHGVITTEHLTNARRPLDEVNEAFEDLRNGKVLRSVITFGPTW